MFFWESASKRVRRANLDGACDIGTVPMLRDVAVRKPLMLSNLT